MKTKELKEKSASELEKMLVEERTHLRHERFGQSGGKSKNVKSSQSRRKDIARILTILSQKKDHAKN